MDHPSRLLDMDSKILSEHDDERDPFLYSDSPRFQRRGLDSYGRRIHLAVLYFVNITLFILLFLVSVYPKDPSLAVYSPANEVVKYETTVFTNGVTHPTIYQGLPTDAVDAAWDELYNGAGLSLISPYAVEHLPNRTVVIPGTGGKGVVQIEVFHQLHCLNIIRQAYFPHRYPEHALWFPNGTVDPHKWLHVDHCIDRIRQQLTCSSNVGTVFWKWREDKQLNWINMTTTHTCRNYERIREWAYERAMPPGLDTSSIYTGHGVHG